MDGTVALVSDNLLCRSESLYGMRMFGVTDWPPLDGRSHISRVAAQPYGLDDRQVRDGSTPSLIRRDPMRAGSMSGPAGALLRRSDIAAGRVFVRHAGL